MTEPNDPNELLVAGPSMGDAVPLGARVEWEPVDPAETRVGDVVVIRSGTDLLVHRVVARAASRSGIFFIHRGDASRKAGIFQDEELVGRVAKAEFRGEPREIPRGPSFLSRTYYAILLRLWLAARAVAGREDRPPPRGIRWLWNRLR